MHPTLAAVAVPPSLPAHQVLVFLLQIGLLLGLALILGRLAVRLGMVAVVGELCTGILVGPSVLGHALPGLSAWLLPARPGQMHLLDAVGQLGVILLVGLTGIEIDLTFARRRAATTGWISGVGLLLPLAAGVAVGLLLPAAMIAPGTSRTVFAFFVGVALCVSAIPVIAKTLLELDLLHRDIGQMIMSAAAVDDTIGWLLLSVAAAAATTGLRMTRLTLSVALLLAAVVLAATVGRAAVNQVLRLSARAPEPGSGLSAAVLILLLFAAGAQAVGTEPVFGGFLGGLVIASSRWADRAQLASLRTVVMNWLAPVFFATAGLRMDLTALGRPAILIAALALLAVAVVTKFGGVYAAARLRRIGHWDSVALGIGLDTRGVIGIVIALTGLQLGVVDSATYTVIVLIAVITSVISPPVLRYATRRSGISTEEAERVRVRTAA